MKINLYFGTSLLLLLSLGIIAGVTNLYYNVSNRYNDALLQIQKSNDITLQSQVVLLMLQDVETAQRGYLLTSQEHFLHPYEKAIKNLNLEIQKFNDAINKHPELKSSYSKLIPLIRKRIDISHAAVQLSKDLKHQEAIEYIKKGAGREIMDSIRQEISNIQNIESAKLVELNKKLLLEEKRLGTIEVLAIVFLVLFILIVFTLVMRGISQRSMLEKELNEKNIHLNEKNNELNTILKESRSTNEELNSTMEQLNLSYAVIQELNQKLQERVEEKTSDLFAANIDLTEKNRKIVESDQILKIMNENLYKTVTELNHRNFELDQFVYKVSHDLRAPLASILGLVEISKLKDGMPVQTILELVENRASKLDHFIRSMLDYSKNARSKITPQLIDFESIINNTIEDMSYMKNYDRLCIYQNIENEVGFFSDTMRIGIIFNSLISNAFKFQDITKAKSYLKISIHSLPSEARIEFNDNGIGIKKEYTDKVFDMFFRASDLSDGSGLGMYILKEAVDYLKGSVSLVSKNGQGTTVLLIIPNLISEKTKLEKEY